MFGPVPKVRWETRIAADRKNRISLGLNCLLIEMDGKTVLVDTGIGSKELNDQMDAYSLVPSRLVKGLRERGVLLKDIDAVILTHLRFDHSGGCTRLDRDGGLVPTFSKAKYMVQRACWEEACGDDQWFQQVYRQEDFRPIQEWKQLELLDGDTEIFPGLWVKVTNGPSRGHQIVLLNHGGERIAFLGDLLPTPHHLDLPAISAFDRFPDETVEVRRELLSRAEREGWLLIFPHGSDETAGYLERRNGHSYLRPIQV